MPFSFYRSQINSSTLDSDKEEPKDKNKISHEVRLLLENLVDCVAVENQLPQRLQETVSDLIEPNNKDESSIIKYEDISVVHQSENIEKKIIKMTFFNFLFFHFKILDFNKTTTSASDQR